MYRSTVQVAADPPAQHLVYRTEEILAGGKLCDRSVHRYIASQIALCSYEYLRTVIVINRESD